MWMQLGTKNKLLITSLIIVFGLYFQESKSQTAYKKKVLETAEIDFLMSYYTQDGNHASVTGGIGNEKLTDVTPTIVVAIPLGENDILTVDVGISAYTSASSSNLDPFDKSGASGGGDDDDDEDDDDGDDDDDNAVSGPVSGSPWVESSGASRKDVWSNVNVSYSHSSEDRNEILTANAGFASEYDYSSIGFGVGFSKLFNQKNTEIGIKGQVYLDNWNPAYPTELDSYLEAEQNLNNGFFANIDILDQTGQSIDKDGVNVWSPINTSLVDNTSRNTYSLSISFSQILSKKAQVSIFMDFVNQKGWLANPMQRVYFGDIPNYYVGNADHISNYTSSTNTEVFHLADDIERLPKSRFKTPIGARFNYYVNESISLRTYYRYYFDDWGIKAHTVDMELPIKFEMGKFTFYPSFRYYVQTEANYFAPYEEHLSISSYYTSDYDLSKFNSQQYGIGFKYNDIFTKFKLYKLGLKSVDLRYSFYNRSDGLNANIVSAGLKFQVD